MNQQVKEQIYDFLRVLLAAGGPATALLLRYTRMDPSDLQLWIELALFVVPPVGSWVWGLYLNSTKRKIETVSQIPDVATIVVKDTANGVLGTLARSDSHPAVVTETQNELDAKKSPRTIEELSKAVETMAKDLTKKFKS